MTPYRKYQLMMLALAERWEHLAETARGLGDLSMAHMCSQRAIRCRFLCEDDPETEAVFNQAGEWEVAQ